MNLSRRMLPLLDVSILLLGLFLVLLAQAEFETRELETKVEEQAPAPVRTVAPQVEALLARVPLVLLYGFDNPRTRRAEVYEVTKELAVGRRVETADDLREVLRAQELEEDAAAFLVVLTDAADHHFTASFLADQEARFTTGTRRRFLYLPNSPTLDFLDKSALESP